MIENVVAESCCATCKANSKNLKRCSRCCSVYYCSVECQRSHWPQHKSVCHKKWIVMWICQFKISYFSLKKKKKSILQHLPYLDLNYCLTTCVLNNEIKEFKNSREYQQQFCLSTKCKKYNNKIHRHYTLILHLIQMRYYLTSLLWSSKIKIIGKRLVSAKLKDFHRKK